MTIATRRDFGRLLASLGLLGDAVEVGTHRGDFADVLLSSWPGRRLYCVDPWADPPGYEEQALSLRGLGGDGDRAADLAECRGRLAGHGDRAALVIATSEQAAPRFADGSLDFVYLDGDHSAEGITLDLRLWWPKLRPGGLLAGHDIVMPGEPGGLWAAFIRPAVEAFAAAEGVGVVMVPEPGVLPWSYYLTKGAP